MRYDIIRKYAEDEKPAENKNSAEEGASSWIPWATAAGGALLTHALVNGGGDDEKEKERRKREGAIKKALRILAPIAAGVGGYYISKGLTTPPDLKEAMEEEKLRQQIEGAERAANGYGMISQWAGNAAGTAAVATPLVAGISAARARIPGGARATFGNSLKARGKAAFTGGAITAGVGAFSWLIKLLADYKEDRARMEAVRLMNGGK